MAPNHILVKLAAILLWSSVLFSPSHHAYAAGDFYVVGAGSPWKRSGNNIYYDKGNVGIGTNTPQYPLQIRDFASAQSHQYALSVESDCPWTIFGNNWAETANTVGVYGGTHAQDAGSCGVWGCVSTAPSSASGVLGSTNGAGAGVKGTNYASSGYGVYGQNTGTGGKGVWGESSAASGAGIGVYGTGAGYGVYGQATNASGAGIGVYGSTSSATGYGVAGAAPGGASGVIGTCTGFGNGVYGYNSANGPGVRGKSDYSNGVYGETSSGNPIDAGVYGKANYAGYGVYSQGNFGCSGSAEIVGNFIAYGTKSAIIPTSQGNRKLYCQESSEVWFEDFGEGQLVGGRAVVRLDPLFLETVTVDNQHPLKVFIQLNDDCNGVYVRRQHTGFEVRELHSGTSSARFTYRVVAKRRGFETARMEADPDPAKVAALQAP